MCAHLLHEDHDLTVFEANDYAGGHTHTVRVDTADETHHVDTGFIVHNDRNYPHFERLLESVGVATQPAPMSFSVSDGRGGLEYNGSSANGLFANRANLVSPSFHRMVRDLLRFNREAPGARGPERQRAEPRASSSTRAATRACSWIGCIVPQASAVWSADPASMWEFPASLLAEFFANHGMFGFTRPPALARGQRRLGALRRAPDPRLRAQPAALARPCAAIERLDDGVEVTPDGRRADAASTR